MILVNNCHTIVSITDQSVIWTGILLYGCETWILTDDLKHWIDSFGSLKFSMKTNFWLYLLKMGQIGSDWPTIDYLTYGWLSTNQAFVCLSTIRALYLEKICNVNSWWHETGEIEEKHYFRPTYCWYFKNYPIKIIIILGFHDPKLV